MHDETRSESPGDAHVAAVPVLRGSKAQSLEFALVLEAKGIAYDRLEAAGAWLLLVAPAAAEAARDELGRYAAERSARREAPASIVPFGGSALGAAGYAGVLILVAYCAGIQLFDVDWFDAGALKSASGGAVQWWRAFTALTLHWDQEHLLGNLLFGVGIGALAGRMFGPGFAWLSILLAGAAGNGIEMWVSPAWHRAAGASTAVFAGLGLLAGFGWGQRLNPRERRLYRWAPLFAGVCLLALLGAGNEHVDVLGHFLGFSAGTALGWAFARAGLPRARGAAFQAAAGCIAALLLCVSWLLALKG
ncbi:MAG: rhomboid family intramembrane serine protease [Steroidobacteraceae bacterium]